jgi:hypothetical protein
MSNTCNCEAEVVEAYHRTKQPWRRADAGSRAETMRTMRASGRRPWQGQEPLLTECLQEPPRTNHGGISNSVPAKKATAGGKASSTSRRWLGGAEEVRSGRHEEGGGRGAEGLHCRAARWRRGGL